MLNDTPNIPLNFLFSLLLPLCSTVISRHHFHSCSYSSVHFILQNFHITRIMLTLHLPLPLYFHFFPLYPRDTPSNYSVDTPTFHSFFSFHCILQVSSSPSTLFFQFSSSPTVFFGHHFHSFCQASFPFLFSLLLPLYSPHTFLFKNSIFLTLRRIFPLLSPH